MEWDGRDHPYKPSGQLRISDRLALHDDTAGELDPVTFEVIATKLWTLNEEHADTIKRASGSPIVVYNDDFNTSLVSETGEPILFGPYIQFFAAGAELIVKYTLENRSASPGIDPGDVFLHNDPLVGGSHQMDISLYAPVFVDGRLFCWVFSSCHVRDCGGVEPGGFCVQAPDIYHEPPMLRAIKIADANGIRADVEDTFMRTSRVPHLLALELRSQMVGAGRARSAVEALCARYTAPVVKGVMRKIVDDAEHAAAERLRRVPDGRWTDVMYTSGATAGDRRVHKQVLTLEKHGAALRFTNRGTDSEFASHNCSYAQFRSSIASSLALMLVHDHRLCAGGVLRLAEFDATPGTITCASREGAVTCNHGNMSTVYQASQVISKMLYPDPELRLSAMAVSGVSTGGWLMHSGTDQHGAPFAAGTIENAAGGIGAFSFRDGIDNGGAIFWPKCEIPDCEITELNHPVLYLYRRTARNGGHGRFRGGQGIALAWVGHGSDDQVFASVVGAASLPIQAGLGGGHWAQTALTWSAHETSVRDLFAAGRLPATRDQVHALAPHGTIVAPKVSGVPLRDRDVVEIASYGGGGFGDPLERDPAAVARDAREDAIPARSVREVYGVVVDATGALDAQATKLLRAAMRAERLARARFDSTTVEATLAEADTVCDVADQLAIRRDGRGNLMFGCRRCGRALCDAGRNYKLACGVIDGSLVDVDPQLFTDPAAEVDEEMTYRTLVCPGCGVALDRELAPRHAPPSWDTWIDPASLSAHAVTAGAEACSRTT
jgi:N-methylhydantoinase B